MDGKACHDQMRPRDLLEESIVRSPKISLPLLDHLYRKQAYEKAESYPSSIEFYCASGDDDVSERAR